MVTTSSLQTELDSLLAELAALETQASPSAPSIHFTFTRNLSLGMSGTDVKELQELLAKDPVIYPEGKVTGYFGTLTLTAIQRFQKKYGIANADNRAYGYLGPMTRAKLNGLIEEGMNP